MLTWPVSINVWLVLVEHVDGIDMADVDECMAGVDECLAGVN